MEKQKVDSRARFAEKIAKEKAWAEEHVKPEKPAKIIDRDYMNENELKREERVKKNAEISFGKAKMPASMQKYADRKK
jgi:uncharacterized protein YktB (UPF0637 family)